MVLYFHCSINLYGVVVYWRAGGQYILYLPLVNVKSQSLTATLFDTVPCVFYEYVSSDSTKSRALGIATISELRLLSQLGVGGVARSRMRVDQCVSGIGALEVPVSLRNLSCSNDISVARIWLGSRQVTHGIMDDLWGLPYVTATGGWPRQNPGLWYMRAAITWLR